MGEDYAWMSVVAGLVAVIWVLSMIPLWVYETLGCLLAAGIAIWLLGVCGVYRAIGSWWGRKSVDGRIRFRKDCWLVVVGTAVVLLCVFFPDEVGIPVAGLVAFAFVIRCSRLRRARRQAESVCDIDERAVA